MVRSRNVSRIRRREFLATASALVAAPALAPAAALGAEGRPAASERVVLGYLGTGPRGRLNLSEQLSCPEAQVVAVCDVWKHARDEAKAMVDAHYGNADCRAVVDFREIIERPDIDAVGIASTDHWHVPMAIAAARAGKDVCVEKPLGVSIAEDLACRETIRRFGRVFQYGTEARASAECRLGAELVRNGRIGQVRKIRVKAPNSTRGPRREPKPVPAELEYELWLGPAPWRPYAGCPDSGSQWFHVYDYALGFIAGWGAHPLDLLQWAFDTHRQGNWEVEGTGVIPNEGGNDAVIDWDVTIRFATGVTLDYFAAGVPKNEEPALAHRNNYAQIIGEEGWVALYYASMACDPPGLRQTVLGLDAMRLPVSHGQERNFIDCVRTRQTPVSHIDDAVRSDIVSHVCDIAIRCGRKVVWDPDRAQFVGDEEANRRMRRAHRAPWGFF